MYKKPAISVIIPVYNREKYIGQAVASVFAQTFTDFEIITVDDGSTDQTRQILENINDDRIRIVSHQNNRGIPNARNTGLEHARGRYIAWLDSDDLCRPQRLQVQLAYLEHHPEIAMIGACAGKYDDSGRRLKEIQVPPKESEDIRAWHLFRSSFKQSSIMGRTDILKQYPYRKDLPVSDDFDVGIRISNDHPVENLYKVLVDRGFHKGRTIYQDDDRFRLKNRELQKYQLNRLGLDPDDEDLERHFLLPNMKRYAYRPDKDYLDWAEDWLSNLRWINRNSRYCEQGALDIATSVLWIYVCYQSAGKTSLAWSMRRMFQSHLTSGNVNRRMLRWLGAYGWLFLNDFISLPRQLKLSPATTPG